MAVCFNYFLSTVIFVNIDISQGSIATYSRCGAIIKYEFAANLLLSLKIVAFQEVIGNSLMSCFLTRGVLPIALVVQVEQVIRCVCVFGQ